MSWSYSGDPSTSPLDYYRFTIGDTDEDNQLFQDEEIEYVISSNNENSTYILYSLYSTLANKFSMSATKKTLGPQSVDYSERQRYWMERAKYYEALKASSGISLPCYKSPKVFYKGMMKNV